MNPELYCGLTHYEANEALAEFCCVPLTEEQRERFEERSEAGTEARGIAHRNSYMMGLQFTRSLDAMAEVVNIMNPAQVATYRSALCALLMEDSDPQIARVIRFVVATKAAIDAPAWVRARAALTALGLGKDSQSTSSPTRG